MLLTLSARCLAPLLAPSDGAAPRLSLLDAPAFTRDTLGLHGMSLATELLVGADRARLLAFRDKADHAGCALMLLIDHEPMPLADPGGPGEKAANRLNRVVEAARVVGCTGISIRIAASPSAETMEVSVDRLKEAVSRAEKLDVNILVAPHEGLTASAERITELVKHVGGFRIGTHPDLLTASKQENAVAYLRRITPYAQLVTVSTVKFTPAGKGKAKAGDEVEGRPMIHTPYELAPLLEAILSVGYESSLAIDYTGGGDVTMGIVRSRDALNASLAEKPAAELPEDEEPGEDVVEE